ncbi:hypothetical protein GCM10010398_67780 [Streptomyces fimbriatus]
MEPGLPRSTGLGDGAALVHRPVALGDLVQGEGEGEGEVEDLARVDPALEDAADQVGQVAAYGGGAAAQADVGEEQLLPVVGDLVRDADEADVPARPGRVQGLPHGLRGADALQDAVGTDAAGQLLDPGHALLAALGDDVGGAEREGEPLAGRVAGHGDDPLRAHLLRGDHAAQADRAVADHHRGGAGLHLGRVGGSPAGAHHVGDRQQTRPELLAGHLVGELSTRSDEFRIRWGAHNVRHHGTGTKRFHHHAVGGLTLAYEGLEMAAEPGLTLTVYTAEPGSASEEGLRLLASWAATQDIGLPAERGAG